MTQIDYIASPAPDRRSVAGALWRGFRGRCPECGEGRMFRAYLKVSDACPHCGEALHHHRADDAPAYFTILVVGHAIIPGALALERAFQPAMWIHMSLWLPLSVIIALVSLPRIKGMLVGLQWALRMHGFGEPEAALGHLPEPQP
ncbi:MAG: DUF983 domain-containing protein [Flavobacteriaceae bacterium]